MASAGVNSPTDELVELLKSGSDRGTSGEHYVPPAMRASTKEKTLQGEAARLQSTFQRVKPASRQHAKPRFTQKQLLLDALDTEVHHLYPIRT